MTKQIQYFMTEDKTKRVVNYTLWLEEGEEKGKVTFSKRESPSDVWGPASAMLGRFTEEAADRVLKQEGFTVKEVVYV